MKKFMFVLIFSSLFITISSCTKNSENYYSCDPTINEWVINNSERIQKLTPSELMEYNLESQKAIFCSMTPQQRFEVWRYKFDSVLTLT